MTWYARRNGRKRLIVGWMLFVLGVIAAAGWLATCSWYVQWQSRGRLLALASGTLEYSTLDPRPLAPAAYDGLRYGRSGDFRLQFWLGWQTLPTSGYLKAGGVPAPYDGYDRGIVSRRYRDGWFDSSTVALWPLPLLWLGVAARVIRSGAIAHRRALAGKCRACGYPLGGLATGSRCPECGKGQSPWQDEG